ncbi:MAG: hypothetical protein HY913_22850 [Desulfomonile tiedjei]|nr:hypothetical protein [Desulfomonile tiedjei]
MWKKKNEHSVDRERLESYPTEEILRILKEEKDDYTPEAIECFAEILESRGVRGQAQSNPQPRAGSGMSRETGHVQEGLLVNDAGDAVRMLNNLLSGVIDRTVDPQVAQVAANIVMGILRAREQEFMTEPQEES